MRYNILVFASLIAVLLLEAGAAFAQGVKLIPYREGAMWGYMNTKDSLVVPLEYEAAYPMLMGRGRVKQNGKYGYIDTSGAMVIPVQFDSASDFDDVDFASVCQKDKCWNIDLKGQWTPGYGRCFVPYAGPESVFRDNTTGLMGVLRYSGITPDTMIKPHYLELKCYGSKLYVAKDSTGRFGLINASDSTIVSFEYDNMIVNEYDGVVYITKAGKQGVLKGAGHIIAHPVYDKVRYMGGVVEARRGGRMLGYTYKGKEYWKD